MHCSVHVAMPIRRQSLSAAHNITSSLELFGRPFGRPFFLGYRARYLDGLTIESGAYLPVGRPERAVGR